MITACLFAAGSLCAASEDERHFTLRVRPILQEKCFACHGEDPDKIKGELVMTSREGLLKGGEFHGDVLVPGDPKASKMMVAIEWADPDLEMPPKENDRLTAEQIEDVRRWIAAGAPWPDEATQEKHKLAERSVIENEEGLIFTTSGGTSDEWTYRRYEKGALWAFQPLEKPELPLGMEAHPIDAFLEVDLKKAGFEPAPQAKPEMLLRRASYDMIGLPPTPVETKVFLEEWQKGSEVAWENLIVRLLSSPHYGERWAQHWFDVARYSDTGGMANDYERSNAWRYRDYVIESLNTDKPYDEFVREQIAGDELAEESRAARGASEYNEEEIEMVLATGFLRMGAWDNAMVKPPQARQIYLDDVVNSVGQTFMSTTMRCFKCHDHKFDPLPTRDYYRMYATFAGTQMAEVPLTFLERENREGFDESEELLQEMLAFAKSEKKKLTNKREAAARAWYEEKGAEYVSHDDREDLDDDVKPPRHVGLSTEEQGQLKVREQDEWIWKRRQERYQAMAQTVYNGERKGSAARKLRKPEKVDSSWMPKNFILSGGALEAQGEAVTPGVLSALRIPVEGASANDPYAIPEELAGRRTHLAQWLTHPRHPLVTRSIVNRIWQYHFGKGIAGNSNNFGVKGQAPTHPELLDWLAVNFVEEGWSLKKLHRLIMTSQVYRQASVHPQQRELANKDPNNHLWAYFPSRRLTAEEVRDGTLRITGELNTERGGLPILPEINREVALQPRMIQFSLAPAWQPSPTPEQRNRRSVYSYRVRGLADPFLELFNQPNPNDSCEFRDTAAVAPQSLTLMNSDLMTDRSIAFALRVQKESSNLVGQVKRAFELALGREPVSDELDRLVTYVEDMQDYHSHIQPDKVIYPTEITRTLIEEFSGEPFTYTEILPGYRNYQPDAKPAEVSPETRALADLCLLILNSNEFMFLY